MTIILGNLLLLSALANAALFVKMQKQKKNPQYTHDARAVLNDLTAYGSALVRVDRVDPSTVFLRSPRDLG